MDLYYKDLRKTIAQSNHALDTSELRTAIDTFRTQAEEAKALEQQARTSGNSALVDVVNTKYRDFQRGFTSQGGLPNREFFKHVVFAPGLDTGQLFLNGRCKWSLKVHRLRGYHLPWYHRGR